MNITGWLESQKYLAGPYLRVAVALGTLAGFLLIAQAWFLTRVVDGVIFQHAALARVMPWLWAMLAIFMLRAILAWASEQAAFHAAAGIKLTLRNRLFRHIQALGPVYLQGERSGDLANTLVDGIEALEAYYARYLPAISLMALGPLSILVFVFPLDWWSGLILLGTAPLIPFFMILVGKGAERLNQRQWKKLARMSAHFLDVIQGLTTLKLFNASRREARVIARVSDDYRRSTLSVLRVAFLSSLALEFFSTVSIAVVAVLIGFRLYWGDMDFRIGFFVLLLAPEFYLPLRNMGTHYHARMEAIGAAERVLEILDTPPPSLAEGVATLEPGKPVSIEFRDVHFDYAPGRHALDGVRFEIAPRERLALVGPSGSGKTTLVNTLLGFVTPQRGEVLVNGVPLATLDLQAWRRQVAWVPQNPRLFFGSVLDNIRLGRADADIPAVEHAARQAFAHEFIRQLPEGYHTLVGEHGKGLSGGQIQRIALARAFLKDAPVVILDEATANLDAQSEALVQAGIENLARDRTLLWVAHRLGTVRNAPRIVVLEAGRVVEQGTHEELMRARRLYARMFLAYAGASGC